MPQFSPYPAMYPLNEKRAIVSCTGIQEYSPPTPLPDELYNSCSSKRLLLTSENCCAPILCNQAAFKRKQAALVYLQSFYFCFLS